MPEGEAVLAEAIHSHLSPSPAEPTWLDLAHKKLDAAVFAAYGWSDGLSDEQILQHLLDLNLERAGVSI
jgi:hypothetical protein